MDRTLHAEKKPAGDQPPVLEHGSTANNEEQQVEDLIVETEFRDLQIEPRRQPVRVRFSPPVVFDGKTYNELTFDFDSMTGKDFIRAERTFQKLYKADKDEMPLPELKHLYHNLILANLADVSYLMIQSLERRYYIPLRNEALKACGSSSEEKAA